MDCLTLRYQVSQIKRCQWAGRWYPSNKMYISQVERDWQWATVVFWVPKEPWLAVDGVLGMMVS